MWRWVLRAVLAISRRPAVQQWVKRRARIVIEKVRQRAELTIAKLHAAADLGPAIPKPKLSRLIRTPQDILHPGQVVFVDGVAFRVIRLVSSNAQETAYEAIEA